MGRYEEELQSYDHATAIDPESDVAWFNRAYALAGLGRWDEAVNAFDRVSELNPSYPYLEQNRGNAIRMRDEAKKEGLVAAVKGTLLPVLLLFACCMVAGWIYYRSRTKKTR
jgi:tetratricopeptide (TPR) repeat protein